MRYVIDQRVAEMLGLAKGIVCDGRVNEAETMAFRQWFKANPDAAALYPGRSCGAPAEWPTRSRARPTCSSSE
jgi:hypothetical protein